MTERSLWFFTSDHFEAGYIAPQLPHNNSGQSSKRIQERAQQQSSAPPFYDPGFNTSRPTDYTTLNQLELDSVNISQSNEDDTYLSAPADHGIWEAWTQNSEQWVPTSQSDSWHLGDMGALEGLRCYDGSGGPLGSAGHNSPEPFHGPAGPEEFVNPCDIMNSGGVAQYDNARPSSNETMPVNDTSQGGNKIWDGASIVASDEEFNNEVGLSTRQGLLRSERQSLGVTSSKGVDIDHTAKPFSSTICETAEGLLDATANPNISTVQLTKTSLSLRGTAKEPSPATVSAGRYGNKPNIPGYFVFGLDGSSREQVQATKGRRSLKRKARPAADTIEIPQETRRKRGQNGAVCVRCKLFREKVIK